MAPTPSSPQWVARMAATAELARRNGGDSQPSSSGVYEQPLAIKPVSVVLAIGGCCVLSCFIMAKTSTVKIWLRLPYIQWLVLLIYIFSFMFVFSNSILQFGIGSELSYDTCMAAEYLCLSMYTLTKVFNYLFLVDRVYIVQDARKARLRSITYLANSFGMIALYLIVVIVNFIFRINFYDNGTCVIGQDRSVLIPMIAFDAFANVYLTILFLIPLLRLYSVQLKIKRPYTLVLQSTKVEYTAPNLRLRRLALRTFIGTCLTLATSVTNLTMLMALNGESSWLCFICCNSDVIFCAIVIQWVTASDHAGSRDRNGAPMVPPVTSVATAVSLGTTGRQSGGKCEGLQAVSSLVLGETPGLRPKLKRRYSLP